MSDDTSSNGNSWNDGPNLLDGQWHHIAVTVVRNSTNGGSFYVDGVSVLQFDPTSEQGDLTTTAPLCIGNHSDPSYYAFFDGLIDELSIYNRALSSNEIAGIYSAGSAGKCVSSQPPFILNQPTNQTVLASSNAAFSVAAGGTMPLFFQWRFNGTNIVNATNATLTMTNVQVSQAGNYSVAITNVAGGLVSSSAQLTVIVPCVAPPSGLVGWWRAEGNAYDSIGNNNGIVQGGLTYGSGEVGQGFVFNGTTGNVKVPASPLLNVGASNGMTIEAWINPVSVSLERPIVEWNRNGYGAHFWISTPGGNGPGCLYANLVDTTGYTHILTSPGSLVVTNVLQHVALTYDRTTGNGIIYLNGVVVAQQNLGIFTPQTSYDLYLGYRPTPPAQANYWWGGMDEVSLYSRVLSATEIQGIYNAGTAGKCFVPLAPAIVSQPTNQAVTAGSNAVFSVWATGTGPLTFQWRFNGTNIVNATNATLTLTNVQVSQAGNYSVAITNVAGGLVSSNALLAVNSLHHFAWSSISSPKFVNVPFAVTISAQDLSNKTVLSFTNSIALSSTNGIAISPTTSGSFVQGVWTGAVVVARAATNLVLKASDGLGHSGLAVPINIVTPPSLGLQISSGTMLISWPTNYAFVLETTATLSPPAWRQVTVSPIQLGGQNICPIPATGTNSFYRLRYTGP